MNTLRKIPFIGKLIPSQETTNNTVQMAKSTGTWIGSTMWILGTSILLISIPLQMASDDERLKLAQVIGLAYGVKLQHANPPNLSVMEPPTSSGGMGGLSGLGGLGSIPL